MYVRWVRGDVFSHLSRRRRAILFSFRRLSGWTKTGRDEPNEKVNRYEFKINQPGGDLRH